MGCFVSLPLPRFSINFFFFFGLLGGENDLLFRKETMTREGR